MTPLLHVIGYRVKAAAMDMNFPHADLGDLREDSIANAHALLASAMARQVAGPTFQLIANVTADRKNRIAPRNGITERIHFFAGICPVPPHGAFLCADTEQSDEDEVYQTISAIGKAPVANPDGATAELENN